MATKIFALLALLALSSSTASAFFSPSCSQSPIAATIPPYLSPVPIQHPVVLLQQLSALVWLQSSLHVSVQSITQQLLLQQLPQWINQVPLANLAAYSQQQQLLPLNPLATLNLAAYSQQQQLLPFNQLAFASPAAFLQPEQLLVAALLQQQQLLPFNQLPQMNPAIFLQQPILGGAIF